MGQEIAIQRQGSMALASETPFSLTSLMALVPDWLNRGLFEDDHFALPQVIPAGGPKQLRDVAQRFRDSLSDFAVRRFVREEIVEEGKPPRRIFDDPLDQILGELRLRTIIRQEHQEEARARFRLLRDDCRKHPTEAVREGACAYAAKNKFFPAGYAEIRPFIMSAENKRARAMHRLLQTADKAETLMERQARVDADPVDPAEVKALLDELHAAGAGKSTEGRKKDYSNVRMPSADELAKVAAEFNGARSS